MRLPLGLIPCVPPAEVMRDVLASGGRATLVRINPDAPRFAPSASPFTAGEDDDDGRVQVRCGTVLGTLGVAQRR